MIISRDVKLKLKLPVMNSQIDEAFKNMNLKVLRWAIIDVDGEICTIRAAIEE